MAEGLIKNPSFQKRLDGRVKDTKLVELLAGMQVKEPQITFNAGLSISSRRRKE